jgi:hypothetical protein
MRIYNDKVSFLTVVCLVVVISGSAVMMPLAINFWYKLAKGHSLSEQLKTVDKTPPGNGIFSDILREALEEQDERINLKANRAGITYASLMILGVHLPATALLLVGVGLLSMSITRECKLLLKKIYWVVCVIGISFFALAIPYSGQGSYFPDSMASAVLIYTTASAIFWVAIGIGVLIRKGWATYIEPELMRQPNVIEKQAAIHD